MFKVVLIVLLNLIFISDCAKYPSELPRCKPGDEQCIVKATQTVFEKVVANNGFQPLGIPTIDPLQVNQIDIKQGSDSPVNIHLILKNTIMIGLRDVQFVKITGFGKEPTGKYEFIFKAPHINLIGDYTVDGKVLILPIVGEGKSNLTLANPEATIKFNGKTDLRNGKEYLQMNNFRLKFTTSRLHIHLSNLYKGDKTLGDSTNTFLNDNWQDIFNELKSNIFDAFGQVFEQVMASVFNRIAYKDLLILE